jgi:hypothetical protein
LIFPVGNAFAYLTEVVKRYKNGKNRRWEENCPSETPHPKGGWKTSKGVWA